MKRPTLLTITAAFLLSGCSLILDFDVGTVDCWCGERWETTLYGAEARRQGGSVYVIAPEETTHIACVSMLEHLVLDFADPNSPTYQSLVAGFEAQAIANCEAAAAQVPNMTTNNCASNQVTLVVEHNGACWRPVNYDETDCSQHAGECSGKYDCADPWIEAWPGHHDETGGDVEWECDEDPGIGAGPPTPDRVNASPN